MSMLDGVRCAITITGQIHNNVMERPTTMKNLSVLDRHNFCSLNLDGDDSNWTDD
jgi:hypothetical protein